MKRKTKKIQSNNLLKKAEKIIREYYLNKYNHVSKKTKKNYRKLSKKLN